uniref:T9SS type A sorting domain-containing protein n=1 Tax=candidate division WOR-3 bacterium TaxID=2052148 RepID=A0A7C4GCZ9_UNCW3
MKYSGTIVVSLMLMGIAPAQHPQWKIWTPGNTGTQGDYSFAILVDSLGRLWAHGYQPYWHQGGLTMFDGRRWHNWSNVDSLCPSYLLRSFKPDRHGNIWMGSPVGLLKFDGTRFTTYNRSNVPGFPCDTVHDVDIDPSGNIWFAMENFNGNNGGIGRFNGTSWTFWKRGQGHPFPDPWNPVRAIACARNGDVWAGASSVGLARYRNGTWTYFDTLQYGVDDIVIDSSGVVWIAQTYLISYDNGIWRHHGSSGSLPVLGLTLRSAGGLWVGCPNGLFAYHNNTWTDQNWPGGFCYLAAESPDGSLWACGIGGVAQRVGGNWELFNISRTGLNDYWINGIDFDSRRNVWMSTGYGICTFDGEVWRNFNRFGGTMPWPYPTDIVRAAVEDLAGRIWVATYGAGLVVWNGTNWVTQYASGAEIGDVIRDSTGVIWAYEEFYPHGLYRIANGNLQTFDFTNSPLPGYVYGIGADQGGYIWVATLGGLVRTDGTNWEVYTPQNARMPGDGSCWAVSRDPNGDVWLCFSYLNNGQYTGLARFRRQDTTWTVFDSTNSPVRARTSHVAVTRSGIVWVSWFNGNIYPYRGALLRYDGTNWTVYNRDNSPLPHEQIYGIGIDSDENPWLSCASEGVAVFYDNPLSAEEHERLPAAGSGLSASPNPFRGSTTIRLGIPAAGDGEITIVDATGRAVRTLRVSRGASSLRWDGRDSSGRQLPAGVYFVRLADAAGRPVTRLALLQ